MGLLILAAFIMVPMIEIGLFIQVGGAIGLWPTLFVVVATAMAGVALLRHQGLSTLARLQQSLDRGEMPLETVFEGFCLLAAGALLLTPGFFTDALGFTLFIPPVRALLRHLIASRIQLKGQFHSAHHARSSGVVIDGEWRDVTEIHKPSKLSPDNDPGSPPKD